MVLLLSWDSSYGFRDRITVAPITSHVRGLDAEVELDHNDGLAKTCVVNLDVVATIPRNDLTEKVAQLGDQRIAEVEKAIHRALGMRLPCPH
jgi:mRNA-degrading endonuclease toxin of MazEF toxin-antitoxin module